MVSFLDMLLRPGGGTVDQVMRDAKAPRLPSPTFGHSEAFMPSENIGEVGERPPVPPQLPLSPHLTGAADDVMFAEPSPQALRLPPPAPPSPPNAREEFGPQQPLDGEVLPPGQPSPGGGLPVQPTGAAAPTTAATPRAAAAQPSALDEVRAQKRRMLMQMAGALLSAGSPAKRMQGVQFMFEIQKDAEQEAQEKQKLIEIDASTADDADKERAKTLVELGARPQDVAEALQFNNQGATQRKERREQFTKWGAQLQQTERDLGTIEVNAERAIKILDEGVGTTGTTGYLASYIPGSAHNKLIAALDPLKTLTGYGYLQEMREQSKTGGAVGNVTENETRWLMGIQGSLDPVNNDPDTLKENIRTIVRGKAIVAEMRKLAPALDAGDPAAWDKYGKLTRELGRNGATVQSRMKPDKREVPPVNESFESKY